MRRCRSAAAAVVIVVMTVTLSGLVGLGTTSANAAGQAVGKATGSVALLGRDALSFTTFDTYDYGATGDRGTVSYTNFGVLAPASNVWKLRAGATTTMTLGGSSQSLVVDSITPTATRTMQFAGHGAATDGSTTWRVTGAVSGTRVTFRLDYMSGTSGWLQGAGTISPDGSVVGSAATSAGGTTGWTLPPATAVEVFSYDATVTCVAATAAGATFGYTIPATPMAVASGVAGLGETIGVTDVATPGAGKDTWGFVDRSTACDGATIDPSLYAVTSGNIVVH